ncbi:GvpL/GvpF family gas vesicle protein [Leptolyngbya sp. 15MV]|nr:GvpL/GvpF family gas vesicle protein [Leptolyngbya sp. 15MV]
MLEEKAEPIAEQLQLVSGRVEMGVRIALDVPNIFQHLVDAEPALRAARDQMVALGSPHAQRVEVGRLFERVLGERRRAIQDRVQDALGEIAVQIAIDPPKTESELLRLAVLIEKARQDQFEAIVHELGAALDATHRLDYSGPWAPHSFVKLDLSPEALAEAA